MNEAASPSIVRQASLRAVFDTMIASGPISRAELARLTGLSKQTTSEVVRLLERGGLIRLLGQTQGPVGRSATTYALRMDGAYVLGVDLGGTKVQVALADLVGGIVGDATKETEHRGGRHVVRQIRDMMLDVATRAGIDPGAVRHGAIGSPGVFRPDTGQIDLAPNIPGLDTIDVAQAFEDMLGFPVVIENDVNMAALGEWRHGCGKGTDDLVFMALGTGIGMGIIAGGRLLRGARGAAGEIAYLPLGGDPFDARGHRLGTLETAIGGAAIVERYRAGGGTPNANARLIFDQVEAHDSIASATVEEVARLLVHAIVATQAILDPSLVVLGGSIGARPELKSRVLDLAARAMPAPPALETSVLGGRAALVGAISVGVQSLHATLFGSA
ncbi:MAG: ROK family transcriptional regulator [Burkholderiales bacterium]|nr:ROK family transcriptional regulator [Burkholderiales bacterium]